MKLANLFRAMILLQFVVSISCGSSSVSSLNKPFEVSLRATSDEGLPVEGAQFSNGASTIGTTDAKGSARATVRGADGQVLPIVTSCPTGYVAPEQPTQLRLTEVRRVSQQAPAALEVEAICSRKLRDIVVVVRTSQAPALPVVIGGKTAAQTDASGTAHLRLQLERDVHSLSVGLATAAAPNLRPQNPSRVFELEGQDAILLFEQSFTEERVAKVTRRAAAPVARPKHVPYRIDSGRTYGY
jgi:hypothetical protein